MSLYQYQSISTKMYKKEPEQAARYRAHCSQNGFDSLGVESFNLLVTLLQTGLHFQQRGASVAFIVFLHRDQLEAPEAWDRLIAVNGTLSKCNWKVSLQDKWDVLHFRN
ncbi:unnamed protein product [Calypogeia fissa]